MSSIVPAASAVTQGERLANRLAHCLFPAAGGESGWPLFAPPLLAAPAGVGGTLSDLRPTADQTWTVAA